MGYKSMIGPSEKHCRWYVFMFVVLKPSACMVGPPSESMVGSSESIVGPSDNMVRPLKSMIGTSDSMRAS